MALKENSARVKIASTLKKENKDSLDALSSETDIPISKLLDRAIELLLKEYQKK
ncbi:ribbon-helix-helix domain-containing protein [Clostridium chromiireducens]|uniref:Ribbon-helix-helix domain-containing protein n=1 Tax=Clostridium chromiireducens TaxID=225345 RepID=A0A964RN28_9CLOT|nr:ribbon-helix-helix domain-containing protein [Clostridium chromiireducens]MVX64623.1 ribbon-helix-helix domain-containing protein [Clostridium chromiireducens]